MYTLAEWTVVSLKNRTMLCRLLTAAVLLLGSLCGRAHCQRLMDVNMDDVAERLGERFQGIRRDALGAQALEVLKTHTHTHTQTNTSDNRLRESDHST